MSLQMSNSKNFLRKTRIFHTNSSHICKSSGEAARFTNLTRIGIENSSFIAEILRMFSFEGEFVFSTPLKVAKRQQLTLLNWSRFIFGAFTNWQIKQLFAFILKVIIWYLRFQN